MTTPGPDATFLAVQSALTGEYSLEREIGRGGMGVVFLARDVQLDRQVAIKVLPATLASRPEVRERFVREAKMAAALSHPNIVPIHRVGDADGLPYFVMTFVRGETLGERLRARGPVSAALLTRILRDVALALGYAHTRQVIHRDIKPDNILIEADSERALVTDFGIAQIVSAGLVADAPMGTAHFMSPEQGLGQSTDGRSDLYSLGVVGYLSLSGRFPFEASTTIESVSKSATESAPPIATATVNITPVLARVIDRCLARDPAARFATADEITTALDGPVAAPALPAPLRTWAEQANPFGSALVAWSMGFGAVSIGYFLGSWRYSNRYAFWLNAMMYVGLTVLPTLVVALFEAGKTRRALGSGYSLEDLRFALRTSIVERRREIASMRERAAVKVTRFVLFALIASLAFQMNLSYLSIQYYVATLLVFWITVCGAFGLFALMTGMGVPVMSPRVSGAMVGGFRSRLWNSRFGTWLARGLTPRDRAVPDSSFRPTEMALGLAVGDLYAALPTAYRANVDGLGQIAERLSQHAGQLRGEIDRLEAVRAHARGDDQREAESLLAEARRDLGQSVGALERMRLELLRLHGGANDLRPLTTSLDAARQIIDDLARLGAANREVFPESRRLPIDVTTPSPA